MEVASKLLMPWNTVRDGRDFHQVIGEFHLSSTTTMGFKAIDKVVFTERGCVEAHPQHPETARVLRMVPLYPHKAALRARLCQCPCPGVGPRQKIPKVSPANADYLH